MTVDYGSVMFRHEVLHGRWIDQTARGLQELFEGVPLAGRRVLDVGFGRGNWGLAFRQLGARVTFAEVSAGSVDRLTAWCRAHGVDDVEVLQRDLFEAPLPDGSFDVVWCYGLLQHLPDLDRALRRIAAWLAPGGLAYLYHYASGTVHQQVVEACRRLHRFDDAELYGRIRAALPRAVRWKMDDDFWAPHVHYVEGPAFAAELARTGLAPRRAFHDRSVAGDPALFGTWEVLCQAGGEAAAVDWSREPAAGEPEALLCRCVERALATGLLDPDLAPYAAAGLYTAFSLADDAPAARTAVSDVLFALLVEHALPGFDQGFDERDLAPWLDRWGATAPDERAFLTACVLLRLRRFERAEQVRRGLDEHPGYARVLEYLAVSVR